MLQSVYSTRSPLKVASNVTSRSTNTKRRQHRGTRGQFRRFREQTEKRASRFGRDLKSEYILVLEIYESNYHLQPSPATKIVPSDSRTRWQLQVEGRGLNIEVQMGDLEGPESGQEEGFSRSGDWQSEYILMHSTYEPSSRRFTFSHRPFLTTNHYTQFEEEGWK